MTSLPHLWSRETGWSDGAAKDTQNLGPGTKGTEGSGKVGRKNVLETTLTPKTEPALPGQSLVFCRGGRAGREEERTVSHRLVPVVRGSEPALRSWDPLRCWGYILAETPEGLVLPALCFRGDSYWDVNPIQF